jgi:anti-sigma B factor antagonist
MEITEEIKNDILILNLVGKLDTITSADLQKKTQEVLSDGHTRIILNFKDLNYVSSAGLRVLLMAQKRVKPSGGNVMLTGVQEQVMEVFTISGFTPLFSFFPSVEEALSSC